MMLLVTPCRTLTWIVSSTKVLVGKKVARSPSGLQTGCISQPCMTGPNGLLQSLATHVTKQQDT